VDLGDSTIFSRAGCHKQAPFSSAIAREQASLYRLVLHLFLFLFIIYC
jgi:hypothetical protein